MLHFLSLTAFRNLRYTSKCQLTYWLTWFCFDGENMKGLDTILERNDAVRESHQQYERFTADKELMEKYEARQKYLRDLSTIKGVSREEGFTDGLQRGIEQKAYTVARAMKAEREPTEKITQYTGLSEEEIANL